ncbi:MAG: hypothetical protein RLZZ436_3224, partial [Planctomycetota bacterium]
MPPGVMPGAPQMPPAMPAAAIPAPVATPQPAAVAQQPPAQTPAGESGQKTVLLPLERRNAPAAAPAEEHEELEFMTELPDIA